MTVKFDPLFAVPPGVVTWSFPLVAPAGTTASILVEDTTVKAAFVVLKTTFPPDLIVPPELALGLLPGEGRIAGAEAEVALADVLAESLVNDSGKSGREKQDQVSRAPASNAEMEHGASSAIPSIYQ